MSRSRAAISTIAIDDNLKTIFKINLPVFTSIKCQKNCERRSLTSGFKLPSNGAKSKDYSLNATNEKEKQHILTSKKLEPLNVFDVFALK